MDKIIARKLASKCRNALSKEARAQYDQMIIAKLKPYLKGKIGLYHAYGSEVCLNALFDEYECGLPVVINDTQMVFYQNNHYYHEGAYGIMEPSKQKLIEANEFDVIVVPLVAFDDQRHRVGHGKGYYDRYLPQTKALKIGVAYEVQKMDGIECDQYDYPLDMIISEANIY